MPVSPLLSMMIIPIKMKVDYGLNLRIASIDAVIKRLGKI
jgi:hypothetical protein